MASGKLQDAQFWVNKPLEASLPDVTEGVEPFGIVCMKQQTAKFKVLNSVFLVNRDRMARKNLARFKAVLLCQC